MSKKRVTCIGLGAMGSPLAILLIDNQYEVIVWNRTPERAEQLITGHATGAGISALVPKFELSVFAKGIEQGLGTQDGSAIFKALVPSKQNT